MAYSTSYKAMLIPPSGPVSFLTWEEHPKLEELQKLVGGYIEAVYLKQLTDAQYTLLVDEEGLLKSNQINPALSAMFNQPLVGTGLLLFFDLE